jgi:hypothetical protein
MVWHPYGDYEVKITLNTEFMNKGVTVADEVMDPWNKIMSEGGGGKTVTFNTKGVLFKGTLIEDPVERDQIDPATNEVKTYKDGNVRKQWVFKFQTDERDPLDPEDKGVRNLWAKHQAILAIRENLKSQGLSRMRIGGTLEIAWTGEIAPDRPGVHPTKTFKARYTEPPAGFMAEPKPDSFSFDTAPVATNSAEPSALDAMKALQASGQGPARGTDADIPF